MRKLSCIFLAAGAALSAAVALAACGGSSSRSTVPATATSSQQRLVAGMTQFAGCMRRHGIPVPDPNSQGVISGSQSLEQQYQDTPEGQAALRACRSYLQAAVPQRTAAQTQEYRHAQLLFARCMRARGIQIADPNSSGDLNVAGIDKASPQFQTAARACAYLRQGARQIEIGG
jgi:hypothetical protein